MSGWLAIIHTLRVLFVIFLTQRALAVNLDVTEISDSAADVTCCYPVSSGLCNLRSAWDACNQLAELCVISLPSDVHIMINTSLGHLALNETANIEIFGSRSTITNAVPGSVGSFVRWEQHTSATSNTIPSLLIQNLSVVGFVNDAVIGGAMSFIGDAVLTIDSCTFSDNSALSGGAIYVRHNNLGIQIIDSVFENCTAFQGGAITLQSYVHNSSITRSRFSSCAASNSGGTIYLNNDNPDLNITDTRFEHSTSPLGGAIYGLTRNHGLSLTNVVFDHCTSLPGDGGGLYLYEESSNVRVIDTRFIACSGRYGGGMTIWQSSSAAKIIRSSFKRCTATENGGGIFFAFYNPQVQIAHTAFTDCTAVKYGGGVGFSTGNLYISLESTNFTNCQGMYGGGSALENHNFDAIIRNCRYINCEASNAVLPLSAAGGGAYHLLDNQRLLIEDTLFVECTSTGYAGAVYIDYYSANPVIRHSYFERCTAAVNGGAIWFYQTVRLVVTASTFLQCTAEKGGAIYVETLSEGFAITECNIASCSSTDHGGGIYIGNNNANGTIQSTNITDCHAGGNGGGIYTDNANNDVKVLDLTVDACTAIFGGGMLFGRNNRIHIERTYISNCAATEAGGGINLIEQNSGIFIRSCVFTDNVAGTYGGGLVSEGLNSGLQLVGTHFLHNQAAEQGGGVYLATGNAQFTVIDTQGYAGMRKVESQHPYSSSMGFWETVTVPGASALILYFDELTRIARQDSVYIYTDSSKSELLLSVRGTQRWPGIVLPPLRVAGDSFYIELVTYSDFYTPPTQLVDNVYGFKLYVTPVIPDPTRKCVFKGNTAQGNGGGLFMFSGVALPMILNTDFVANEAHDGGGVALRNAITGMTIESCRFVDNIASGSGGGLQVASANYGLLVLACLFSGNFATLGGGGIAFTNNNGNDGKFLAGNENVVEDCEFTSNGVAGDGGAIMAALNNRIVVLNCRLMYNIALTDGGAIAVLATNVFRLENSLLHYNGASGSGGGLASRVGNNIDIVRVNITGNSAERGGGAISMNSSTVMAFFSACKLDSNSAGFIGGGIALFSSPLAMVNDDAHLMISNNRAERGSGIYYNALIERPGRTMRYTSFAGNAASVGGTVFWVFDQSMRQEPTGVSDASVLWGDNLAPYGNVTATQAVRLIAPSGFEVQSYGSFISPAPVISLRDYYNQFMPLDGPTSIQTSISGASADQCDGRFPYLSGTDVLAAGVQMSDGQAKLSSLEASCAPHGHITLQFAAQLNDLHELDVEQYVITNTTAVTFRACRTGEVIVNGQCVVCPRGTFSLEETVSTDTICKECLNIDGVHSCSGSTIVLEKNYWRRYPSSLAVLPCMDDLSGCNGGSATGVDSCMTGYGGALCSVCSGGYYRSERQCLPCNDDHPTLTPVIIFYICIAIFSGLVVGFIVYRRATKRMQNMAPGKYSAFFANVGMWLNKVKKSMSVQLKILITTFQITSTIPTSMKVEFPASFRKFLNALSVFNLNIVSVVPINCGHSSYNFIDKMVMITLAPIFASIGLFLLCIVEYVLYMSHAIPADMTPDEYDAKKSKIISRWLTYFFFLTYLVLPSVSTTIFKTFLCTDLDPLNEDENKSDLYLTADMRVSCSTDYYKRAVAYASIMILVYVVGIPAMYLAFLWRCRKAIMSRFDAPPAEVEVVADTNESADSAKHMERKADLDSDSAKATAGARSSSSKKWTASAKQPLPDSAVGNLTEKKDSASQTAVMIAFLYEAYEPQYWYWEVIETTRRLMLTAVLSVCGTGSAAQAIFAVLLALMYIKLYGFYSPYNVQADDIVAETGQFQIFLSFLGALIYQRQLLGTEWNGDVSILLILINTAVAVLFVYFGGRTLVKAIQESAIIESGAFKRGFTMMALPTVKQLRSIASPRTSYAFSKQHSKVHADAEAGEDLAMPLEEWINTRNAVKHENGDVSIQERDYSEMVTKEQTAGANMSAREINHV